MEENPNHKWIIHKRPFFNTQDNKMGKKNTGQDLKQKSLGNQNAGTVKYYGTEFFLS